MLRLVGTDGERYFSWDLRPGKYILGRKDGCDFCVPNSTVSRNHASFDIAENGELINLTDLGSHNGTTVNSVRLTGSMDIRSGDRLGFGQVEFKVVAEGDSVPPKPASVRTELAAADLEKSVVMSIDEALKSLPSRVSHMPDVFTPLSDMARMLVLPEPQEAMLGRALELVAKAIPAEKLAVLIASEDEAGVTPAATYVPGGKDIGGFQLSRTIINDILTNKNAILIEDPRRDPRYAKQESVILSGAKSAMAVPLFDEGQVLGILYVDTVNPLHRYNDEYLRLLATFGNIIAARLQNYALLTERQERRLMEAEVQRAAAIQKHLLTQDVPEIPGYQLHAFLQPSRRVGGDLYDVRLLPDGRLVFMVADVSGKGMGAALLMSDILSSFRVLYHDPDFELLQAVTLVSQELCAHSAPGDFATLFIGILDPRTHNVRYLNAGHNSPLLVAKDGGITYLESSGTMIGIFANSTWTEDEVQLNEDDLLCIFTDGVNEAARGEEQYEDVRLTTQITETKHCSASEVGEQLLDDIMDFADDASGADDITMLIIKQVSRV